MKFKMKKNNKNKKKKKETFKHCCFIEYLSGHDEGFTFKNPKQLGEFITTIFSQKDLLKGVINITIPTAKVMVVK